MHVYACVPVFFVLMHFILRLCMNTLIKNEGALIISTVQYLHKLPCEWKTSHLYQQ